MTRTFEVMAYKALVYFIRLVSMIHFVSKDTPTIDSDHIRAAELV